MMTNYATIEDLETIWKKLTDSEKEKATALLEEASAKIRVKAKKIGKDFDEMIVGDEDLAIVTKGLICNAVKGAMTLPTGYDAMSQMSQSAGGYTFSGTFANPGGGIRFSKNDWKSIGLGSQRFGALDIYGMD